MNALCVIVLALHAALLGSGAHGQSLEHTLAVQADYLDESLEAAQLDGKLAGSLKLIRMDRAIRLARSVEIHVNFQDADLMRVVSPNGTSIVLNKVRTERRRDGGFTWYGRVSGGGEAILELNDGRVFGYISADGISYEIRNFGRGRHIWVETDLRLLPQSATDAITPPASR